MDIDNRMRLDILACQTAFLRSVGGPREDLAFADRWEATLSRFGAALADGSLTLETISICRIVAQRLAVVSSGLCQSQQAAERIVEGAEEQSRKLLESKAKALPRSFNSDAAHDVSGRPVPSAPNDLLAPYRRWFLDHFAHPYLTSADKNSLHLLVPSQSQSQCATWFINCRRRSGWGDLYKRFGAEKKEVMERFIREVDSPLTSWQVSEEARREVEKVRDWFRDEEKNAVGRGIAEVVEQAGEIEVKGKVAPMRKKGRKPPTNLGIVAPMPKQEEQPQEDLKVDPLPLPHAFAFPPAPRNISDSSSRDFSGLSHFSVDSSSTSASSFYSASPMAFELPSPADTFSIAEQSAYVYPSSSTHAQEPNPYFSTLADFPYSTNEPTAGRSGFVLVDEADCRA